MLFHYWDIYNLLFVFDKFLAKLIHSFYSMKLSSEPHNYSLFVSTLFQNLSSVIRIKKWIIHAKSGQTSLTII